MKSAVGLLAAPRCSRAVHTTATSRDDGRRARDPTTAPDRCGSLRAARTGQQPTMAAAADAERLWSDLDAHERELRREGYQLREIWHKTTELHAENEKARRSSSRAKLCATELRRAGHAHQPERRWTDLRDDSRNIMQGPVERARGAV